MSEDFPERRTLVLRVFGDDAIFRLKFGCSSTGQRDENKKSVFMRNLNNLCIRTTPKIMPSDHPLLGKLCIIMGPVLINYRYAKAPDP